MTVPIIQCMICAHLLVDGEKSCKAFPKGIPGNILTGDFDHATKHPDQDNDIVFEEIKE